MDGAGFVILMVSALTGFLLVSSHQICYIESEYDPKSDNPHRWVLPYKDPCKCTAIRLGGMNTHSVSYRQGAPYYLDKLIFSEDPVEIQEFFGCSVECLHPEPLGLEDGTIPDESISASTGYTGDGRGRLNKNYWNLGYRTELAHVNPWIEVDLIENTLVSGVITQSYYGSLSSSRMTQFKVKYHKLPKPSSHYDYVIDDKGDIQVFDATDGNTVYTKTTVTNIFHESIKAARVRIEPGNSLYVALRLELLGCRIN